jgi:DNA polymerase-3 subunit alpha
MKKLFADLPDAIINIQEIIDKVEIYSLYRDVLLQIWYPRGIYKPEDEVDNGVRGENAYLRHLTMVAEKKIRGTNAKFRRDWILSIDHF